MTFLCRQKFLFSYIYICVCVCVCLCMCIYILSCVCVYIYILSFQSLSRLRLFVTPWTPAYQAALYITNSRSLLKLMSIESVMPFNHHILCCPVLLMLSIFPSIRVFSNESILCIRWPSTGASASASVLPVNIQDLFPL